MDDLPWWKTANIYHIYPYSFMDSNGDGIGDFQGIIQKVSYLKEIGITAVWLSPIFKSPQADLGYDISDFLMVDPIFGTNQDLVDLIVAVHNLGIKILLDLVPNHTSDEHIWFQKSIQNIDPYTDYYIWKPAKYNSTTGERMPPNNWVSNFSGGAWEWNENRQEYYLHQFMIKQPDLNYRNPLVKAEILKVMKFYFDKGIDGFRVDAVPFIYEVADFRDNPVVDGVVVNEYTQNQEETYALTKEWGEFIYQYSLNDGKPNQRALFLEAYATPEQTFRYYGTGELSLVAPFNFFLLKLSQNSRPSDYRNTILEWVNNMPPGTAANWVLGNHDNIRAANRFGREAVGFLNIMTGVLPGNKITYYGEEIGMDDTFVRFDQTVDPAGKMQGPDGYLAVSRDPERTPMQWDDSDNAGFSTNPNTWLPVNPDYWNINVATERNADTSNLKVYQAMTKAREDPILRLGDLNVLVPNEDTLVIVRSYNNGYYVLIINMGSATRSYTTDNFFAANGLDMDFTIVVSTINASIKWGLTVWKGKANIRLRPQAAVLLKSGSGGSRGHGLFDLDCFVPHWNC